jgi:hypothetical protein
MKTTLLKPTTFLLALFFILSCKANTDEPTATDSIIIDHNCTDVFTIPVKYVEAAKKQLVIAYGHTSHGSQLITSMDPLDQFMTSHGYASGLFTYNSDGSNNALQIHDAPFDNAYDLGNPDFTSWYQATRDYLNDHNEVNVIMWSWCGEASWASTDDIDGYLSNMTTLEKDFPNVKFVYMTGHLDGSGAEGQLNQNNDRIRNYCKTNKKILFDFADIESYDPDGKVNYMKLYANDNCDYTTSSEESRNWATDWQASHTENVDWYSCDVAHSQSLNGNRKAYAAWWLFARLTGWDPNGGNSVSFISNNDQNPKWMVSNNCLKIIFPSKKSEQIDLFDINGRILYSSNRIYQGDEISLPLTEIGYKQNDTGLFRLLSDGKSYTGKFIVKTF